MESSNEEIKKLRAEKYEQNTKALIEKFRPKIEKEGAKIDLVVLSGNVMKFRISGSISADLTNEINEYMKQFLTQEQFDALQSQGDESSGTDLN